MALKTSQLNDQRANATITLYGEEINLVYNPQGFTPALEKRINDAGDSSRAEALVFMLRSMLVSWDLVEDVLDAEGNPTGEEHPLGTTVEVLMNLPIRFLLDVTLAIANEIKAVVEEGNSSVGTSPPTAK